ncbi:MAG TPA: GNAT family N-acetyltransferase [Saprospiraceae bacterium]|nr:GNAT family N-acetyltransferase [Saprospiraceae bacterium]HND87638.1 GNAT family N-acetyltransferase [Saprospiraceae bacterium]HNG90049.1 GNAT family N-acetyltransferase [Saprospiraceae bacterium]
MATTLTFTCLPFSSLSPYELYDLMALRQEVFVVEQNCPYLDADGRDLNAWHLMGRDEAGRLLCYTRLLPKGVAYAEYMSIGRVVSSPSARGARAGKAVMLKSIQMCYALFGLADIKIGAQTYLLKFYEGLGFRSTGEEYLEDGIPHTKMIKPKPIE